MTLPLTSTCVGGRRSSDVQHEQPRNHAHIRHDAQRAGLYKPDTGVGGQLWGLTRREVQVLEAVIEHGLAKVAAGELGLAGKTLECHITRCRQKSGYRHMPQLVAAYVTAKVKAGAA